MIRGGCAQLAECLTAGTFRGLGILNDGSVQLWAHSAVRGFYLPGCSAVRAFRGGAKVHRGEHLKIVEAFRRRSVQVWTYSGVQRI